MTQEVDLTTGKVQEGTLGLHVDEQVVCTENTSRPFQMASVVCLFAWGDIFGFGV